MIVCTECGAQVTGQGAYCPVCGAARTAGGPRADGVGAGNGAGATAGVNARFGDDPRGPSAAGGGHPGATTEPEAVARTRVGVAGPPAPDVVVAAPFAGVGRRVAVAVLDSFVTGILPSVLLVAGAARTAGQVDLATVDPAGLVAALGPWYAAASLLSLVTWFALTWWEGATGAAVGARLLGVRTVDALTRAPIGLGRALVRNLVVVAGSVVVIGWLVVLLSPLFDSSGRRQGWHDKASRAVVTRGPAVGQGSSRSSSPAPSPAASPTPVPMLTPAGTPVPAPAVAISDPWSFPAPAATPPQAVTGLVTGVPTGPASAAGAPTPMSPPPAAVEAPDEEGWDATRLSVPGAGVRLAPAPVRRVALVLPDGTRVVVAGPTLVGRDPQAATDGWTLVPVTDPARSVSKTHAELDVDEGGLWVTDRGSTNGTVVSEPERAPRLVAPGSRARVPVGAALHLGELRLPVEEVGA